MAKGLQGHVAIVTGGGGGIGRGVCQALAEEGAAVMVNDVGSSVNGRGESTGPADQVVEDIRKAGGTAVPNYASVATFHGGRRIVEAAIERFGRVDILCHLAGTLRDRMIFNMTEEDWDSVVGVHLTGAFNIVRHAVPHMVRQGYGRIILFASVSGLGNSGQANYSAAKEGLVGFSRSLAQELQPYSITVNAVYPGGATRMAATVPQRAREVRTQRQIVGGAAAAGGADVALPDDEARDPFHNAAKVVYLATEAASDITGQVFGTSGWAMSLYSPRQVVRLVSKTGRWSLDELDRVLPRTLTSGLVNPAPPAPAQVG